MLTMAAHPDNPGYFILTDSRGNRYSITEPVDGVLRLSSVEPGNAREDGLGLLILAEAQNSHHGPPQAQEPSVIDPTAMFAICAAGCLIVIGVYAATHPPAKSDPDRLRRAEDADLSYADAMRILDVPEDHPPGVLTGLWGEDPSADAWWYRCTRCRVYDLNLTPVAAALEASTHACTPTDLARAQEDARRRHPAHRDPEDPR